jgi:hypothetical protein
LGWFILSFPLPLWSSQCISLKGPSLFWPSWWISTGVLSSLNVGAKPGFLGGFNLSLSILFSSSISITNSPSSSGLTSCSSCGAGSWVGGSVGLFSSTVALMSSSLGTGITGLPGFLGGFPSGVISSGAGSTGPTSTVPRPGVTRVSVSFWCKTLYANQVNNAALPNATPSAIHGRAKTIKNLPFGSL